jgi:GAF domain-containing protein
MLPQGPEGPAPVRQLLPVIVRTRHDRWAIYARMDTASGLLDHCWAVGPDESMEDSALRLEPVRVHPALLHDAETGAPIRRLDNSSALLLQELIPPLRGMKIEAVARALRTDGSLSGVLVVVDRRSWLPGRRSGDPVIEGIADVLETELAREPRQRASTAGLERGRADRGAELDRLADGLRLASTELEVLQRTIATDLPRLAALEDAVGRGTELLASAHADLERSDRHLRRFRSVLAGLRHVLDRHASGAPPRQLAGDLVQSVADAFQGSRCSLLLCDLDPSGRDCLRMAASLGLPSTVDPDQVRVRLGEGISGWVAINGAELVVRDSEDAERLPLVNDEAYTGPAFASFPLVCHGRFAGVLNLTNFQEGTFDDAELEALRVVALTVALIVDHARLNERMFAFDPA